jgi:hypothetical protein
MSAAAASVPVHDQGRIAPIWHTIGLLVLLAVPVVRGIYQQSLGSPNSQIFSSHSQVFVRFYIPAHLRMGAGRLRLVGRKAGRDDAS